MGQMRPGRGGNDPPPPLPRPLSVAQPYQRHNHPASSLPYSTPLPANLIIYTYLAAGSIMPFLRFPRVTQE